MRRLSLFVPFVAIIAAVWSAAAPAQTPAPTVTVFEGARIITGDGRAPLENASFVVNGARFTPAGTRTLAALPTAAATSFDSCYAGILRANFGNSRICCTRGVGDVLETMTLKSYAIWRRLRTGVPSTTPARR